MKLGGVDSSSFQFKMIFFWWEGIQTFNCMASSEQGGITALSFLGRPLSVVSYFNCACQVGPRPQQQLWLDAVSAWGTGNGWPSAHAAQLRSSLEVLDDYQHKDVHVQHKLLKFLVHCLNLLKKIILILQTEDFQSYKVLKSLRT